MHFADNVDYPALLGRPMVFLPGLALLFEALTGKLPYPPGNLSQTFRRHRCDPPADVRQYAGGLPPALAGLVTRLLARDPDERPSAGSVVQQLVALEIALLNRRRAA